MKSNQYFEKYLDAKFDEISNTLLTRIKNTEEKIDNLTRAVMGNGRGGIIHRLEKLENFRQYLLGIFVVVSGITGFLAILIIDLIKKMIQGAE